MIDEVHVIMPSSLLQSFIMHFQGEAAAESGLPGNSALQEWTRLLLFELLHTLAQVIFS